MVTTWQEKPSVMEFLKVRASGTRSGRGCWQAVRSAGLGSTGGYGTCSRRPSGLRANPEMFSLSHFARTPAACEKSEPLSALLPSPSALRAASRPERCCVLSIVIFRYVVLKHRFPPSPVRGESPVEEDGSVRGLRRRRMLWARGLDGSPRNGDKMRTMVNLLRSRVLAGRQVCRAR